MCVERFVAVVQKVAFGVVKSGISFVVQFAVSVENKEVPLKG